MRIYRHFLIIPIVFIISSVFVCIIINIFDPSLHDFKILDLTRDNVLYSITLEDNKAAKKYYIEVYDSDNNKVFKYETDDITKDVELYNLKYKAKYYLSVTECDKRNKCIKSENKYSFIWDKAGFNEDTNIVLKDNNAKLLFDGDISSGKYFLIIKENNNILEKININSASYTLSNKYYQYKKVIIDALLMYDDEIVSKIKLYNNINPISDIKITSPVNNYSLYDNVTLNFNGGDNAKYYKLDLYKDNKFFKTIKVDSKKSIFDKDMFEKNSVYTIKVTAINEEYSKTSSITFNTISKERYNYVNLASKQVGNKGNTYWKWYGYNFRVEWCGVFVSWLANENGVLNKEIPKFDNVGVGAKWFKSHNRFQYADNYTPVPGDIVFFDWNRNGSIDHVGLVEKIDDKNVYTIEGNSKDIVRRKTYSIHSNYFYGYGVPNY